jgi:hypothetical protein
MTERRILDEIKARYIASKAVTGQNLNIEELAREFGISADVIHDARKVEGWDELSSELSGIVQKRIEDAIVEKILTTEKDVSQTISRIMKERLDTVLDLLPIARDKLASLIISSGNLKDVTMATRVLLEEARVVTDFIVAIHKSNSELGGEKGGEEGGTLTVEMCEQLPVSQVVPEEVQKLYSDFDVPDGEEGQNE